MWSLLLPSPCLEFQSSAPIPEAGFLRALEERPSLTALRMAPLEGLHGHLLAFIQLLTAAVFATCDGEHLLGTPRVP